MTVNYLIADLTTVHKNHLEINLSGFDLHSGQVFILFELWKSDGQSQMSIAKNLNLSAPTINKMVKGLAESGFLTLQRSKTDTRVVEVFLTEKGTEIRPEIENIWRLLEDKVLDKLTETEKLIFFQLMEKVLSNFYT